MQVNPFTDKFSCGSRIQIALGYIPIKIKICLLTRIFNMHVGRIMVVKKHSDKGHYL